MANLPEEKVKALSSRSPHQSAESAETADVNSNPLDQAWTDYPNVIRAFLSCRPEYEQLGSEVAYILRRRISSEGVEVSNILSRAKTMNSFLEKIRRKGYENPVTDVTDLAGVRVVYLYRGDRESLEQIIESEFRVIEKVNKIDTDDHQRFGYGALHYLVSLGPKSAGARYDDLKNLVCEIQVRTVLQDAWAIIDHHLSYKQDEAVPKILKRKLNSLAGLFETADDQFDRLRDERSQYVESVRNLRSNEEKFLNQPIDQDTFSEYLRLRFSSLPLSRDDSHFNLILGATIEFGFTTLRALDDAVQRTRIARRAINAEQQRQYAVSEVACAVALIKPEYRDHGWPDRSKDQFERFSYLVDATEGE